MPMQSTSLPIRMRGIGESGGKPKGTQELLAGIHPHDMLRIQQIAYRMRDIALHYRIGNARDTVLEANPAVLAIDLAIVHVLRDLNLQALLIADNLALMKELGAIQQNIIRDPLPFFPDSVILQFARKGSREQSQR